MPLTLDAACHAGAATPAAARYDMLPPMRELFTFCHALMPVYYFADDYLATPSYFRDFDCRFTPSRFSLMPAPMLPCRFPADVIADCC